MAVLSVNIFCTMSSVFIYCKLPGQDTLSPPCVALYGEKSMVATRPMNNTDGRGKGERERRGETEEHTFTLTYAEREEEGRKEGRKLRQFLKLMRGISPSTLAYSPASSIVEA